MPKPPQGARTQILLYHHNPSGLLSDFLSSDLHTMHGVDIELLLITSIIILIIR